MPVKVLLVDDNALFLEGIVHILEADGRFEVVGRAGRGLDAVAAAAELKPELILMDLQMPGMTGVEAIRAIRARDPDVPIGVLTMFETADYVKQALRAGARGYVAKDATPSDFCTAAAALAAGERDLVAIPERQPAPDGDLGDRLATLTDRELQVLRALTTGASYQAIARTLGISTRTLRNHISHTYQKLGIFDRAQAAIVAVQTGLVEIDARSTPSVERRAR
jgi:DNA-binding NarL/FixJ family response regulator